MDNLRQEENAAFTANKAELEKGLAGLKLDLQTKRMRLRQRPEVPSSACWRCAKLTFPRILLRSHPTKTLQQANTNRPARTTKLRQMRKSRMCCTKTRKPVIWTKHLVS